MHTQTLPEQAMYIFNHASTLDILTILSLGMPRVRYVAKWELQYNPVFFLVGRSTGQIFIRRQRSQKAVHTLQKAAARLRRHKLSIMMAPEGTRKHQGRIGPFKKGPFRMALDLGLPIVPIYIDGNQELSQGGSLIARPGTSTSHVLPAIDTSSWTVDALDEKIAMVRDLYVRCDEDLEAVLRDHVTTTD
jgi:1-acyl-sn-glycerol-3-phosphate acyltransferase